MRVLVEMTTIARGLDPLTEVNTGDTSTESIGGTPPNCFIFLSTMSTPASALNVAHMSQM